MGFSSPPRWKSPHSLSPTCILPRRNDHRGQDCRLPVFNQTGGPARIKFLPTPVFPDQIRFFFSLRKGAGNPRPRYAPVRVPHPWESGRNLSAEGGEGAFGRDLRAVWVGKLSVSPFQLFGFATLAFEAWRSDRKRRELQGKIPDFVPLPPFRPILGDGLSIRGNDDQGGDSAGSRIFVSGRFLPSSLVPRIPSEHRMNGHCSRTRLRPESRNLTRLGVKAQVMIFPANSSRFFCLLSFERLADNFHSIFKLLSCVLSFSMSLSNWSRNLRTDSKQGNLHMFDGFHEKFFETVYLFGFEFLMGRNPSVQILPNCFLLLIFAQSSLKKTPSLGESVGDGLRGRRDPPVTLRT